VKYLSLEEILILHEYQIETYGGKAGINDIRMLESSVLRPQTTFDGKDLYEDIYEKAVALLFSLIKNRPFVDGNKRIALHATITFLELNGSVVNIADKKLVRMCLDISNNLIDEKRAVEIIKGNSVSPKYS